MLNEAMEDQKKQQVTIFYNGQIAVCDATEIQVSAIILLANGEKVDESLGGEAASSAAGRCSPSSICPQVCDSPLQRSPSFKGPSPSPLPAFQGLAMKRSLQRFLQKRKYRTHTSHPYHHPHVLQKFL
ncbi:OLC1v1024328C1 [Oldenlandia corymbosa var. corymbosa]|uniref:Protein TIFY n=2 Tax=Oldenlandia corymbosa var. corymbosa TaxID=529605 RepID=A0AAV1C2T5_OLDCO|nr:OLC1v1024328C1 [Oldenlandia corymbosa var. corymbosa]